MKRLATLSVSILLSTPFIIKIYKKLKLRKLAAKLSSYSLEWNPLSRREILDRLKSTKYDLIIIGGGSVGAGCALDAATRGLRVALVERGDFGEQTSSRSTKMLHGGIRYIERGFSNFDFEELKLVFSALCERNCVYQMAPYLCKKIEFIRSILFSTNSIVRFFILSIYNLFSFSSPFIFVKWLNRDKTVSRFSFIEKNNLKGSIIYNDIVFDDSRLNLILILTSLYHKADAINYVSAKEFIREGQKIIGVRCEDKNGFIFDVRGRGIISTAGPFTDEIMRMKGQNRKTILPSIGTHLVLNKNYGLVNRGYVGDTTDGRLLYLVPWLGHLIIGTTDNKSTVQYNTKASASSVQYLIEQAQRHIDKSEEITMKNVTSIWAGIRPLAIQKCDSGDKSTSKINRGHSIEYSEDGVIFVTGGKWTTFRRIAQETIDMAIRKYQLNPKNGCVTMYMKLLGADGYKKNFSGDKKLVERFGNRAERVYQIKGNEKLDSNQFYTENEIRYSVKYEMAEKISDVLCRRTRLAFIDVVAASKAAKLVAGIFKQEKGWSKKRMKKEIQDFNDYLEQLGLSFLSKEKI